MIEFIDNQTIKFTQEGEEETCGCLGKGYCQPVRFTDQTQFQIKGSVVNSDPAFGDSYVGWETWATFNFNIESVGVSVLGACDGQIIAEAFGTPPLFEYKINNGEFQESGTFTWLCEGTYLITILGPDGYYRSKYVIVGVAYDCSTLNGSDANDVILIETNDIINCYANDLI